jgi:hypothetical protein
LQQTSVAANQRNGQAAPNASPLPAGTTLQAELIKPVDARKNKPGAEVLAKVTHDVKVNGSVVIPKGETLRIMVALRSTVPAVASSALCPVEGSSTLELPDTYWCLINSGRHHDARKKPISRRSNAGGQAGKCARNCWRLSQSPSCFSFFWEQQTTFLAHGWFPSSGTAWTTTAGG